MKSIKEYITEGLFEQRQTIYEGLFDDEDDLIDNTPEESILQWLEENTDSWYVMKNHVKINNGIVYHTGKIYAPYFFNTNPPNWIKFDKNSWKEVPTGIKYNALSQKDINNIPGEIEGIECDIIKNLNIKNSSIIICNIKDIENINLFYKDPSVVIHVTFQNSDWKGADITEKMLTELHSKTNHIIIDIRKSKLAGKFLRQIKKYGVKGFYEKNKNLFNTLFNNGVEFLTLGMYSDIEIYADHIEFAK